MIELTPDITITAMYGGYLCSKAVPPKYDLDEPTIQNHVCSSVPGVLAFVERAIKDLDEQTEARDEAEKIVRAKGRK